MKIVIFTAGFSGIDSVRKRHFFDFVRLGLVRCLPNVRRRKKPDYRLFPHFCARQNKVYITIYGDGSPEAKAEGAKLLL